MSEYVKKEDVLAILGDIWSDVYKGIPVYREEIVKAMKDVGAIPASDVSKIRHGRWDYYKESLCIRAHARCSVCNRPRYEHYVFNDFMYCPSCGAKMDEGETRV